MNRRLVILIILLLALSTASCNMIGLALQEDRDKFVGTWEDSWGTTFVFKENGGCEISEAPIGLNWSINSDKKTLKIWSILWIFSIEASYYFIDDDTISYVVSDLSILAREWYSVGEVNHLYRYGTAP